jgi:hypothetical protein
MFYVRYQERGTGGALVEVEAPLLAPMDIEYPERRLHKVLTTNDGATVIQRPLRDSRPRKWIWRGHGRLSEPFASQWALLERLEYRARLASGLVPTVGIWEDVSGTGGFGRRDESGSRVYTTVKLLQANRTPRQGGGPVIYDSVVEFYVDDPTYQAF